jgi:DNA ligase-1
LNFSTIVDTFEQMEQTSSRLALTKYLVSLLKKTPTEIIDRVIYLIQSKLHPDYEGIELGLAEKMAIRAISLSTGLDVVSIEQVYRKTGDLGDTAGEVMKSKNQTTLFAEKMTEGGKSIFNSR